MNDPHAQQGRTALFCFWAFLGIFFGIFLLNCSCQVPAEITYQSEDKESCFEASPNDQPLAMFRANCPGDKEPSSPILYAHFLQTTLKDDIAFDDVIDNRNGTINCAPGPFALGEKDPETKENAWSFLHTPDYFVWHIENQSLLDVRFNITNQGGFPLRSQVIKLKTVSSSSLVLFLKTDLIPNSTYYLYLTTKSENSEKTWIQPISVSTSQSINKNNPRLLN